MHTRLLPEELVTTRKTGLNPNVTLVDTPEVPLALKVPTTISEHINYTENSERFFLKVFSVIFKCSDLQVQYMQGNSQPQMNMTSTIECSDFIVLCGGAYMYADSHSQERFVINRNGIEVFTQYLNNFNIFKRYPGSGHTYFGLTHITGVDIKVGDTLYYYNRGGSVNYFAVSGC